MRHDPQRFTTFVLGAFACVYYMIIAYQTVRIRRRIGRSPVAALSKGPLLEKLKASGGALVPLIVLLWAYDPARFAGLPHIRMLENWPVRVAGLFFLCSGMAILWTAFIELGDEWRIGIDPAAPSNFVQSGIYGSIRHPIYSSFWLSFLGMFLMAPNLLFALLWTAISTVIIHQARTEEEYLSDRFGKPYRDYMLRTGRFLPLIY